MNKNGEFEIKDGVLIKYHSREDEIVVVPDGVTKIADRAFAVNAKIKEIVLPEGVVEIEGSFIGGGVRGTFGAFGNCFNLETIYLPNTLRIIGPAAFSHCKRLKNINLPEGLTEIGTVAFADCESLEELIFPKSLSKIGDYAFQRCKSLKTIIIENEDCKIDDYAFCESGIIEAVIPAKYGLFGIFEDCKKLEQVTITTELLPNVIPGSVMYHANGEKEILDYAETTVYVGAGKVDFKLYAPYFSVDHIMGPDNKKQALCGMVDMLKSGIEIDDDILSSYIKYAKGQAKRLLPLAMDNEDVLKFMTDRKLISAKNTENYIEAALKTENPVLIAALLDYKAHNFEKKDYKKIIKEEDKKTQKGLHKASLIGNTEEYNNTFFSIEENENYHGEYLINRYKGKDKDVAFPKIVNNTEIVGIAERKGSMTDSYRNLERVVIPEGYKVIGKRAFKGCINLEEVVLPASLNYIEDEAFADCPKLKGLILPVDMHMLGRSVFKNSGLEKIYIKSVKVLSPGDKWYSGCPLNEVYIVDGNNILKVPKKIRKKFPYGLMSPLEEMFLFIKKVGVGGRIDAEAGKLNACLNLDLNEPIAEDLNLRDPIPVCFEINPSNTAVCINAEDGRCIADDEMRELIKAANDIIGEGKYKLTDGFIHPDYWSEEVICNKELDPKRKQVDLCINVL